MWKHLLAKLGHGSARVDLVLEKDCYALGDEVRGRLIIHGGEVEQKINGIHVDLVLHLWAHQRQHTRRVTRIPFPTSFVIGAREVKEYPFTFRLPYNLPLSGHGVSYVFHTTLDIAQGADSLDSDPIQVVPPARLARLLQAFAELGFREKHGSRSFNGYVQEFEFFPTAFLHDRVKEVEFTAAIDDHGIRLWLEMECHSYGHEREIRREWYVTNEVLDQPTLLTEQLRHTLEEMAATGVAGHHTGHYTHGHGIPSGHGWHGHGTYGHPSHGWHGHGHHGHFSGGIGGFAAGMLGGMIAGELLDDAVESITDNDGGIADWVNQVEDQVKDWVDDAENFLDDIGDDFGDD
ncbi:sporulation protein [Polycladomyces subterraneus]|uniref:sporulation protein n=1 Tax=Polycladomyces subterraneus TaxID=1016997 RepID=UPI00263BBF2E|nr:sporulation protein [Polycladomyces subterraneus]